MSVDDKKTSASSAIENVEMSMTVESSDVVKLVLQYLKENNLLASMQQLQRETGIALNTVDNIDSFQNDIKLGRWDSVLNQLTSLKLPMSKMVGRFSL
jgi:WD40 repeat-containing protein SMU1